MALIFKFDGLNAQPLNEVQWEGTDNLKFENFKDSTPDYVMEMSDSNCTLFGFIKSKFNFEVEQVNSKITTCVYATMLPDESFIKNVGDKLTLMHEQCHFNIVELHCRMFKQQAIHVKSIDRLETMYHNYLKKIDVMQDLFDKACSKNSDAVYQWDAKIKMKLEALKTYQNKCIH